MFSKNLVQKCINKKFKLVEVQNNYRFQDIIDYRFKLKLFTNLMKKIKEKVMIILHLCATLEKLALCSLPDSEIQDQYTNFGPRHIEKYIK